jgi:hypothetical protein
MKSIPFVTAALVAAAAAAAPAPAGNAGGRTTFHDLAGPFACRGAQATGVYSWRLVGRRLTLTAVREPCSGRKTILTKPFTRIL